MADDRYKFVDGGSAPEFFASGLHDVELMGSVARFVFYVLRPGNGGKPSAEPPLTLIAPIEAIGPAIALTICRIPKLVVPALGQAALSLLH